MSLLQLKPQLARWAAGLLLSVLAAGKIYGGGIIISEFMAANTQGEKDEDGQFNDWIELFNGTAADQPLAGWALTDDPKDPAKWIFPSVTLRRGEYLLVFASGKDRRDPLKPLHTNFKLNKDGGFLALKTPAGETATEFSPYPRQLPNISFGIGVTNKLQTFVKPGDAGKYFVPSDDALGISWTQPGFDDAVWTSAHNGIGFDRLPSGQGDPADGVVNLADVTNPGDPVEATSSNSPANEGVTNAIDNNTATKYLNFDFRANPGFTVTPAKGATVVTGLRITSANDGPERDPASYSLSGSNDGTTFIPIASGTVPVFSARFTPVVVTFSNVVAYTKYRLLFPTVRNPSASVAMQISEVEFLGQTGASGGPISDFVLTEVDVPMFGKRSSVMIRFPFQLGELPPWDQLLLNVRYEDGFAAWINGRLAARANIPASAPFNAFASTNRYVRAATLQESFDVSGLAPYFLPGTNVLAIQVWNDRVDSPNLLAEAQLGASLAIQGAPGYFVTATPRRPNSASQAGIVADPVFSQLHGYFSNSFNLVMTCATDAAEIRYTLNGSSPSSTNGFVYTAPIHVAKTTIIRAVALKEGWRNSREIVQTYIYPIDAAMQTAAQTIQAGFPQTWNGQAVDYGLDPRVVGPNDSFGGKYARTLSADLQTLPSMSLVMDMPDMFGSSGIYSNPQQHGSAWERAGSIELIYPDGRPGFQERAGIRIQGGAFRGFNLSMKKSFRVIFRSQYGNPVLKYPLFGGNAAKELNNFVLRANSNDAWKYGGGSALYVRDAFAMETVRAMGNVSSHSTFVHLYINGFYWGLYNPAERPDAAFCATYHGGDKSTWDAINQDSVPDGNYDAWNRMLAMLSQDFTQNAPYQKIQGNNPDGTRNPAYENLLDVDNMIDYMIMNFYIGNTDWPGRNWWAGRDRNNGDGFKFHPWDSETALGFTGLNANVLAVNTAVARPYAALRANADFRLRFADHVYRHFFNGGVFYVNPNAAWSQDHPENNRPAARFYALCQQIDRAIVGESARWGDQLNNTPFTRDEHWQPARDSLLISYFPKRSGIVLQQLRAAGLFPSIDPPVMNVQGGTVEPGFKLTLTAPAGTIYYTTDGTDPRNIAVSRRYSAAVLLTNVVTVKTRVLNGTEWSALNEARFVAGAPQLRLNELHYHPANPSPAEVAAGFSSADDFEFLEFWNNGSASYDLSTLHFEKGIQFDFASAAKKSLAPGEYLLLVRNRAAFEMRHGTSRPIIGEYTGKLDNAGEQLQLVNAQGGIVLDFAYGVRSPWPATPDGDGPSLEVIDPNGGLNDPSNWRASDVAGGSPGQPNPPPSLRLQILGAANDLLSVAFGGRKGLGYTVQTSDKLPNWTVFDRGAPLSADTQIELKVPMARSGSRFYRVTMP